MWQSLFERNERIKLQRENAEVGANAERQREEAEQLRNRLEEERRRVAEAEGNARWVREGGVRGCRCRGGLLLSTISNCRYESVRFSQDDDFASSCLNSNH